MIKFAKSGDIIVAVIILLASFLVTSSLTQGGAEYAVIYVDGNEFGRYGLPSNQKQIITLIYFEGKTQKEVAEILHKEKSTISRNLEAAHKKIKKFFTKK